MRLDRYLADCRVGTRNECKKLIKAGRVSVMGSFVTDCAYQVKEGDEVAFDGKVSPCRVSAIFSLISLQALYARTRIMSTRPYLNTLTIRQV